MAKTYRVGPNQSMIDVAINACGTVEALMAICRANDVSPSNIPAVGIDLIIPDNAPTDAVVLKMLKDKEVVVGTANVAPAPPEEPPAPLQLRVLLLPLVEFLAHDAFDPYVEGEYAFNIKNAAGWVNYNALVEDYLNRNPMRYSKLGEYTTTGTFAETDDLIPTPMADRNIPYEIPAAIPADFMLAWTSSGGGEESITFADVEGNSVFIKPLIVLSDSTNEALGFLFPELSINLISSTTEEAVISLVSNYPGGPGGTDIASMGSGWFRDASGADEDPAHPGDLRYRLMTCTPGIYTIGRSVNYRHMGTATNLPPAKMTAVFEIY